MATVSDITDTPLSGLNHIDALLDKGPDWNYLSNSNANVLFYTFSTASGNETGKTGQEAFSAAQQAATRAAFTYLQQITGIEFRETGSGTAAQIHLANIDLEGQYTTGLCSWQAGYRSTSNGTLTEYTANAYVYLDNAEWRHITENLTAGTQGYETLLHELGHALGLKHSFREGVAGEIVLPGNENNTSNTLMSYDSLGGWHSTYSPYDIAAFNWLYGGDGLRGELGLNGSGGRYITGSYKDDVLVGTQFNDTLQGNGGNDMIDGGAGIDTVVYNGNRNSYTFGTLADGGLAVSGAEGTDTLRNIDWLQFADMKVERANVVSSDTVAPAAPVMAITQNQDDDLLGIVETGTADLNQFEQPQLRDGKVTRLMGFEFVHINGLPVRGAAPNLIRSCPVWVPDDIILGVWQDVKTGLWNDTSARNTPYWHIDAYMDCTRREDVGVHVIECVEAE